MSKKTRNSGVLEEDTQPTSKPRFDDKEGMEVGYTVPVENLAAKNEMLHQQLTYVEQEKDRQFLEMQAMLDDKDRQLVEMQAMHADKDNQSNLLQKSMQEAQSSGTSIVSVKDQIAALTTSLQGIKIRESLALTGEMKYGAVRILYYKKYQTPNHTKGQEAAAMKRIEKSFDMYIGGVAITNGSSLYAEFADICSKQNGEITLEVRQQLKKFIDALVRMYPELI